jgi:hypothetical protein
MTAVLVLVLAGVAIPAECSELMGVAAAQTGTADPSALPSASPAAAPSASPGASASPAPATLTSLCDVWTTDQVAEVLGGDAMSVDESTRTPTTCRYTANRRRSFNEFAAQTGSVPPPYTYGDQTVDTLAELVKLNFPDSVELEVAGVPALQRPTQPMINDAEGWTRTDIYVFPSEGTVLQAYAQAPEGVDSAAAVAELAAIGVPRLALIAAPMPSPSGPAASGAAPSAGARTGLAARYPAEIGGSPVEIEQQLTGREYLSQVINFRPMEQRITRALRQRDRRIGDLSFVVGSTSGGTVIAAFQVEGGPIRPFVNVLLESLAMERTGRPVRPEDVAGKDAFEITPGFLLGTGDPGYAYPSDDVLWLIFAPPTSGEEVEILEQLP